METIGVSSSRTCQQNLSLPAASCGPPSRPLGLALVIWILTAPPAPAARSWDTLQTVPRGSKLVVELKDGTAVKGKMASASEATLTLSGGNNGTGLDRDKVARIYRVRRSSLLVSVLAGAGIGVIPGSVMGAMVASRIGKASAAAVGIFVVGIGAGVGAAVWALRKPRTLIYEAPSVQGAWSELSARRIRRPAGRSSL